MNNRLVTVNSVDKLLLRKNPTKILCRVSKQSSITDKLWTEHKNEMLDYYRRMGYSSTEANMMLHEEYYNY